MANKEDSAKVAELLVGAGLELNKLNKFGRSALAESVLSDNFGVMEVLVKAGANTEGSLSLASARRKGKMVEYLRQKTIGTRDLRTEIRFEDIQRGRVERKRKEVEAKKKEKKKLLDKAKTSLKTETQKMEEEMVMVMVMMIV